MNEITNKEKLINEAVKNNSEKFSERFIIIDDTLYHLKLFNFVKRFRWEVFWIIIIKDRTCLYRFYLVLIDKIYSLW